MNRYIDAEEAIQLIKAKNIPMFGYIKQDAIDCIASTTTADVQEVRRGKWVVCGMFDDFVKCSCCGYEDTRNHVIYENLMYCGKCGAKMDEEES